MNANSKQNSMEKLQAAPTSIPVYPKGAFLVLFPMYFTHLTLLTSGETTSGTFFFEVRHPRCVGSIRKESLYIIHSCVRRPV